MHIGVIFQRTISLRANMVYIGMQCCQKSPRYLLHVLKVQHVNCGIENPIKWIFMFVIVSG